ncbi:hypothetical protein EZS27_024572, partial [termite gut metagenome]
ISITKTSGNGEKASLLLGFLPSKKRGINPPHKIDFGSTNRKESSFGYRKDKKDNINSPNKLDITIVSHVPCGSCY